MKYSEYFGLCLVVGWSVVRSVVITSVVFGLVAAVVVAVVLVVRGRRFLAIGLGREVWVVGPFVVGLGFVFVVSVSLSLFLLLLVGVVALIVWV